MGRDESYLIAKIVYHPVTQTLIVGALYGLMWYVLANSPRDGVSLEISDNVTQGERVQEVHPVPQMLGLEMLFTD